MKVEIINKDEVKNIIHNHGMFACTCYDTPDKYADKVGAGCQESGHMSGSRCEYIKFKIYDVDRGTCEQMLRHEVGVKVPIEEQDNYYFGDIIDINPSNITKNMASFRYIDKNGFTYTTPKNIENCKNAKETYDDIMKKINAARKNIKYHLEQNAVSPKKATEDANFVLPRATNNSFVIGFTLEALIHFMHKRLCLRAQDEIRAVAIEMKKQVLEILPEYKDKLVPHCQHLLWCPEGKMTCGAYPTKKELKEILKSYKKRIKGDIKK